MPPSPSSRPLSATVATLCIAIALGATLVSWAITGNWREPVVPFIYAGVFLLIFVLIRALYLGNNLARWLIIIWTALGISSIPTYFEALRHPPIFPGTWRSIGQIILYVIATIMYLSPSSRL